MPAFDPYHQWLGVPATERMLNEAARARVTLLNVDQKVAYDDQLRESLHLPSSSTEVAPSDILSAEVDRLCDTLKQRDRQLDEQFKAHASAVKQLLAKVEKRYQHLMGEVGSLKKELGQQRRLLKDLRDSGALVSGSAN